MTPTDEKAPHRGVQTAVFAVQVMGQEERARQLGEFGGLEADRPQVNPPPDPFDGRAEQGRRQGHGRQDHDGPGPFLEAVVVEAAEEGHGAEADRGPNELALDEIEGVAPEILVGPDGAGGIDHHQSPAEQEHADQKQGEIRVGAAFHRPVFPPPAALISSLNRRPRSSKSRNWSKEAQAGDRSRISPGSPTLKAVSTAVAKSPQGNP